jgi:hypothetical protein
MNKYNNVFLLLPLLALSGCTNYKNSAPLGAPAESAQSTWVYLCGLTQDFNSPEEIEKRKLFNELGKKLNINFLTICPPTRCPEYNNALCWPHETRDKTLQTYQYIMNVLNGRKISGFIGFSNGGFFLHQLVQTLELDVPCITIGASGYLHTTIPNTLYLLISKDDIHHYTDAIKFYTMAQNSPLTIHLSEYVGGHIIPWKTLESILSPA